MWGLILSTTEAAGEGGEEDRGVDEGEDRGEVGREIDGEDSDDNSDDSDSDNGSCKESKSAVRDNHYQNSSNSSSGSVTALEGSTVPTGFTVNTRNNGHHIEQEKKKRKERLMVDEEGMRGVCQNVLSVMGQSLSLESMSSVIYGLRKEGGPNE